MKFLFFIVFLSTSAAANFDHNHRDFGKILRKVVHHREGKMLVDYRRLKRQSKKFNPYLDSLSAVSKSDYQSFDKNQKMAFLINAHNAFALKLAIDHYPLGSITEVDLVDWKQKKFFNFLGETSSIAEIEKYIDRGNFQDARLYFALSHASMSGPNLIPTAYRPSRLDRQLKKAERNFLKERNKNLYEKPSNTLNVSKLFQWFGQAFADQHNSVEDYLRKKFKAKKRNLSIVYNDYDWTLNDWKKKKEVPQTAPIIIRRWSDAALASPLQLKTSDTLQNYFQSYDDDAQGNHPAEQMMKRWNESLNGRTFFEVPSTSISNKEYDDYEDYSNDQEMGIYVHSKWFEDLPDSVLAMNYFKGYKRLPQTPREWIEIIHSDIIVNGQHSFGTNPNSWSTYHLPSVILHEMGHFIGLGHTPEGVTAVMAPSMSRLESYATPMEADKQNLKQAYPSSGQNPKQNSALLENEVVRGWTELHTDGTCRHFVSRQLVKQHATAFKQGGAK